MPTDASGITPVTQQRTFREIVAQIRAMLADGRLRPGDRLPTERDLAATLGVSRGSVREAIRALEAGGVLGLRTGVGGGAYVLPGSADAVVTGLCDLYRLGAIGPAHLTEARIWVEASVVRAAAERATEEDLADLEHNVRRAATAEQEGDFARRIVLHREFHRLLTRAAHNPVMEIMMEGVLEVLRQFVESIGDRGNLDVIPSRLRLLEHLRARDAEAAAAEMTDFLTQLHARYMERWHARRAPGAAAPTSSDPQ